MSNLLICDIDGVLADCSHRLHYLEEKNYDKFYSDEEVTKDTLIYAGYELVRAFILSGAEVHFVTGRNTKCRNTTVKWLIEKANMHSGTLAMRDENDYRPSPIVKIELIKEIYRRLKVLGKDSLCTQDYHSTYFIDDDPENVKAVCKAFPNITGITFGTERMK